MKFPETPKNITKESDDLILLMEAEAYHAQDLKAIANLFIREMKLSRCRLAAMEKLNLEALAACKEVKTELRQLHKSVRGQKTYLMEKYRAVKKVHNDALKAAEKFKKELGKDKK